MERDTGLLTVSLARRIALAEVIEHDPRLFLVLTLPNIWATFRIHIAAIVRGPWLIVPDHSRNGSLNEVESDVATGCVLADLAVHKRRGIDVQHVVEVLLN